MTTPWGFPDFDAHEALHFVTDEKCGLQAIIAIHSTHLGPAAGGARFWHYAEDADALTDALRLSRGMSYKNAMAGLPLGGGKAVHPRRRGRAPRRPRCSHAFGKAVDRLGGRYVTAEDVGMSVADMIEVARQTQVRRRPAGRAAATSAAIPGPHTSLGVFLGIKAAVKRALGKDSLDGLHIALQGAGSVATGVALHACAEGAQAVDRRRRPGQGAEARRRDRRHGRLDRTRSSASKPTCSAPARSARSSTEQSIAALKAPIVAGGANNQLATPEDGERLHARGILYAPDYVINAGGIINVSTEYLGDGDAEPGPPADRGHPGPARADLGRERSQRAAIRRRSPTPWRSG